MKNLYKNGIWVLLILIVAGGYYYYKTKASCHYYGYFASVSGLETGSPVLMRGVQVGKVEELGLIENGKVRVTLLFSSKATLPGGSVMKLVSSGGLFSGKNILIIPGDGKDMIAAEAVLPTESDPSMTETASAKLTPIITEAKLVLGAADSGLSYFNIIIRSGLTAKAVKTMIGLDSQSRQLSATAKELNQKSTSIATAIRNASDGARNLAAKNSSIDSSIHNAEKSTTELQKKELQKNVSELKANIAKLNNSLGKRPQDNDDKAYRRLKTSMDTLKNKVKTMSDNGAKNN